MANSRKTQHSPFLRQSNSRNHIGTPSVGFSSGSHTLVKKEALSEKGGLFGFILGSFARTSIFLRSNSQRPLFFLDQKSWFDPRSIVGCSLNGLRSIRRSDSTGLVGKRAPICIYTPAAIITNRMSTISLVSTPRRLGCAFWLLPWPVHASRLSGDPPCLLLLHASFAFYPSPSPIRIAFALNEVDL